MNHRCAGFFLIACVAIAAGCKKIQLIPKNSSTPPPIPAPSPDTQPGRTIARVHWLGKNRIAADTNAAALMGVWNLPESAKLESQTLEKFSLALWPMLHRATDAPSGALLRRLLDDVLQQESYLEIRQATNGPGQMVFAIRLEDARAGLWRTNLAIVLESLTGLRPVPAPGDVQGWSLHKHHAPDLIELSHARGWTLIGAAQGHNSLLDDLSARVRAEQPPFAGQPTNFWLEADLDLPRLANAFSLASNLTAGFPRVFLTGIGQNTNVHTHVDLNFDHPLPFEFGSWNPPTNLIHGPVTSLAMVRGFGPWLANCRIWNDFSVGPPPNQFYVWAEQGPFMSTYFAAPWQDASNRVKQLTDVVLKKSNSWWTTNADFGFDRARDFNGLAWRGLPFLWPYLRSTVVGRQEFVAGGLFPTGELGEWPSPVLPSEILNQTNLVYYGWEMTGPRVDAWLYISQFFRHVTRHPQLPSDSASLLWLQAISPRLGKCVTKVSLTTPDQLSMDRLSTVGFTGMELHLLADWLESPVFPKGLHTLSEPSSPP